MEAYEALKRLVISAQDDITKAEAGNRAAGTRARQTMQAVKKTAQEIRTGLIELRDK